MFSIKQGRSAAYLQAYTNGEMHAGNRHRNEEETWFLVDVDMRNHIYAFVNWRNGLFLSAKGNGCARADSAILSASEQWRIASGMPFGFLNASSLQTVATNHFRGAQDPGNDLACGGEVGCGIGSAVPIPPSTNNRYDNGWWVIEPATEPTPGGPSFHDILGVALQVIPVALSVIAAL